MFNDGPKRSGRFIKKDAKVLEKISLLEFHFDEISDAKVVSPDNPKRTIIHAQYHTTDEIDEGVVTSKTFNEDLVPEAQRRPVLLPLDFTAEWERNKKLRKDRASRLDDEEFDFEYEAAQRFAQEKARQEGLAADASSIPAAGADAPAAAAPTAPAAPAPGAAARGKTPNAKAPPPVDAAPLTSGTEQLDAAMQTFKIMKEGGLPGADAANAGGAGGGLGGPAAQGPSAARPSANSAGVGGAAGQPRTGMGGAGQGGMSGTAGQGGMSGTAGQGGMSGTAGQGGMGGAGQGGMSGTAGQGGMSSATGQGGMGGATGQGGAGVGAAGQGGAAAAGGQSGAPGRPSSLGSPSGSSSANQPGPSAPPGEDFIPTIGEPGPVDPEVAAAKAYRQRLELEQQNKTHLEQLSQEAKARGYNEGFRTGEEKGELQVRQAARELFGKVGELMHEFAQLKHTILDNVQENFYVLAQAMAEALLQREFTINPETFVTVLRRAINDTVAPGKFKIKVHPDTFDRIVSLGDAARDIKEALVKDQEVGPGDFKIESELSMVDVNVGKMIAELLQQADLGLFDKGPADAAEEKAS